MKLAAKLIFFLWNNLDWWICYEMHPACTALMPADASWVITASVTKVHARDLVGNSLRGRACVGWCHHAALEGPCYGVIWPYCSSVEDWSDRRGNLGHG